MTHTKNHCSTPDQLLTFLRGQLSAGEEAELQQHLDDCVSGRESGRKHSGRRQRVERSQRVFREWCFACFDERY